jgi:metallo-beta-lactamase class B
LEVLCYQTGKQMSHLTKRRWLAVLLGVVVALFVVAFTQWRAAIKRNRSTPDEPFRITGNLYYVGAAGVTSFLLTGPEGDVLIDGGYPATASAIMASIAKLSFDIHDVKVLLNTHAHADHAGGLRALQQASGAELWISEGDAPVIAAGGAHDPTLVPQKYLGFLGLGRFPAPRIDHVFTDGATIRLGPIGLTAHVTAGHTPGCTSWSFPVRDGDRELLAVDICSLALLPFISLVEPETYPGIRADFERSFRALRSLPADIFLGSHSSWFNLQRKFRQRADAKDPVDPFVDRSGYLSFIDRAEATFRKTLAKQQGHP